MNKRWTEQDLSKFENQSGRRPAAPPPAQTKLMPRERTNSKYGNEKVTIDGWTFDSKLEGRRYEELKLLQKAGKIRYFLCQVPFRLPGHAIFRADFMIVWGTDLYSGGVTFEDAHGADSALKNLKLKQVFDVYGVEVKLVRQAGGR
jgi:hypothetical protein